MQITLRDSLPFATVTIEYAGVIKEISDVLIDTGSGTTVIATDVATEIGIVVSPNDRLHHLRGIGGHEAVFRRKVDRFHIGDRFIEQFAIEIGGMDYGFDINGIVGMNFLRQAGAVLNLRDLTLDYA